VTTVEELDAEARELVERAGRQGLALRTVGGVGIWQRLDEDDRARYRDVRPAPRDIDLLAPVRTSKAIKQVFAEGDWTPDERLIAWRGDRRHRYFRPDDLGEPIMEVDVFLGAPPLCHPIEFGDRIGLAGPAMPASDLLLQKLQIVESNPKDLVDICFLVGGEEAIEADRVAGLLAHDWGFHHTATGNLDKAGAVAGEALGDGRAGAVRARIAALREAVDGAPKSRRWRLRAKVGTRAQWYEEVEEVDR
jgi:hypothetical protein